MRRDRLTQAVFGLVTIASLMMVSMVRGPLETERDRQELVGPTSDAGVAARPMIAVMQLAPGGLRAVALNYLWIRSQQLKDDGRLYDAKQLRELICDLMPYYSGAWNFMSWDMAWNISVATHTPEERWMWVYSGITLLRDRGLVYNPDDLLMHKQIAWTYFSKMGEYTDEMHRYYKLYWAEEMDRTLGSPPVAGTTADAIDAFRPVAEAPRKLEDLLSDEAVAALVARFEALGVTPGEQMLVYYNRYSDDLRRGRMVVLARSSDDPEAETLDKITALMADPKLEAPRAKLIAFTRRKVLTEDYRMDVDWMLALMIKYGPLDWRSVHPHAIYWATRGLYLSEGLGLDDLKPGAAEAQARRSQKKAGYYDDPDDPIHRPVPLSRINRVNTERIVLGALKSLTRSGQIYYRLPGDHSRPSMVIDWVDWGPDWRFIEETNAEYKAGGASLAGKDGKLSDERNVLRDGHRTYLTDAVLLLYLAGREQDAQDYYDELRTLLEPKDPIYKLDLHEFCIKKIPETLNQTFDLARAFRHGALLRAYRALANGRTAEYNRYRAYAKRAYDVFVEGIGKAQRFKIRSFIDQEGDFLATMLLQPEAVGLRLTVLSKSTVYRAVETGLQQRVYGKIAATMRQECQAAKYDFNKAFPAPPRMAPRR